jgi:copper resistance protein C
MPARTRFSFSQALEPAFTTVKVFDPQGRQVDKADKAVDPNDATVVRVSLPALSPGRYRVVWRALSTDTHVSEGDFTFDIVP